MSLYAAGMKPGTINCDWCASEQPKPKQVTECTFCTNILRPTTLRERILQQRITFIQARFMIGLSCTVAMYAPSMEWLFSVDPKTAKKRRTFCKKTENMLNRNGRFFRGRYERSLSKAGIEQMPEKTEKEQEAKEAAKRALLGKQIERMIILTMITIVCRAFFSAVFFGTVIYWRQRWRRFKSKSTLQEELQEQSCET